MQKVMFLSCLAAACLPFSTASADDGEETAVRERIESYVSAFNAHDAQALAAHWTEQAEYVHPMTEQRIRGREAIAKAFAELFQAESQIRLRVDIQSLLLVDTNVAIEDGTATILSPEAPPEQAAYTVVHVKKGDQWLRASVREVGVVQTPQGAEALKDLAWMVGEWRGDGEPSALQVRCQWTGGGAFLSRIFTDGPIGGTQIIGWDPSIGQVRSWTFDSQGGFSEAIWSWQTDRWVIKATAVLPDGGTGSEQRILIPDGKDRLTWRSVGRQVNGKILPGTDEVVVVRAGKP